MRKSRQLELAELLAECERELADLRDELDGTRDAAVDERLARAITRVNAVAATLQIDARARSRNLRRRLRDLTTPRLGLYEDRLGQPLVVPTTYLRTAPPNPPPRITVAIASYQQGRYIERTLYSVASQAYPALECVVQDGGSDDGTVAILERHGAWLTRWRSQSDGGQADAINRCFAGSSGDIMCYLNSDDMLLPGALSYVARKFVSHPDWDVIYGHALLVSADDACVGRWILPAHDDEVLGFNFQVLGMFWRRSAWEAAGGRVDDGLRFAFDWDLMLRMRDAGAHIVRVPRFLTAFRIHDAQKTRTIGAVGEREALRLRKRATGRAMTGDEALARSAGYNRRHVALHTLYACLDLFPRSRSRVRVTPPTG